jgi:hypothetical protein
MSNVAEELPGLRGTFNGNPDEVVHALSAGSADAPECVRSR